MLSLTDGGMEEACSDVEVVFMADPRIQQYSSTKTNDAIDRSSSGG